MADFIYFLFHSLKYRKCKMCHRWDICRVSVALLVSSREAAQTERHRHTSAVIDTQVRMQSMHMAQGMSPHHYML